MSFVACMVLPNRRARVVTVSDPERIRDLRRTVPVFLLVCAFECDPETFKAVTSWEIPSEHPLDLAAFIFRRAPLPAVFNGPVTRLIDSEPQSAGLLVDWFRAVEAARDVSLPAVQHPLSSPGFSAAYGSARIPSPDDGTARAA